MNDQERGISESFGEALAQKELEIRRLKSALNLIAILDSKKNVHLGRPRSSDLTCIACVAYLSANNGAYGEYISQESLEAEITRQKEQIAI